MLAPSPIRDILQAIGEAVKTEMLRLANENGKYPLRAGSPLAASLRVEVSQARGAGGRFAGYTADSALTLYAKDYAVWLDSGRKAFAKKVPIQAIIKFIKDRGLKLRDKKSGRFAGKRITLKGRNGAPDIQTNQLAFMIQNAIYKNGIRGRHFIQPAFQIGQELTDIYLNENLLDSMTYELDRQLQAA